MKDEKVRDRYRKIENEIKRKEEEQNRRRERGKIYRTKFWKKNDEGD